MFVEAVFIAMVGIVPSYRLPAACFELARHEKSTSEAIQAY
jgi:hypothetical protein